MTPKELAEQLADVWAPIMGADVARERANNVAVWALEDNPSTLYGNVEIALGRLGLDQKDLAIACAATVLVVNTDRCTEIADMTPAPASRPPARG